MRNIIIAVSQQISNLEIHFTKIFFSVDFEAFFSAVIINFRVTLRKYLIFKVCLNWLINLFISELSVKCRQDPGKDYYASQNNFSGFLFLFCAYFHGAHPSQISF